ncbi:Hypp3893 [Branchiostoma lanceolatum]|uniref:Hypp2006 protein n=1 Tax=Branchiostoma lanceolatum TaxID=7740 RepID=A0A8J9ZMV7_BRALA|nr:Hypp2006 [Branchiostoma lanceolatum]CAH1268499.1 Hypp3893 [Branchiostoma lanceolatum]
MRKQVRKRPRKNSSEQKSPVSTPEVQRSERPPPTPPKMAGGVDPSLDNISPELRPLVQLLSSQNKSLHDEVMAEFKSVRTELSEQIQTVTFKLEKMATEVSGLRDKTHVLEETVNYQSKDIEELQQALHAEKRERIRATLVAERYSMKPDIIIRGLPYRREEHPDQVVYSFLSTALGINNLTSPLVAVHRLSPSTQNQPNPPMLVRLVSLLDRELILNSWRKLAADKKRGFAVHEHLPKPVQQARSRLMQDRDNEITKAKAENKEVRAFIRVPPRDTCALLVVNGKTLKKVDGVDILLHTTEHTTVKQVY